MPGALAGIGAERTLRRRIPVHPVGPARPRPSAACGAAPRSHPVHEWRPSPASAGRRARSAMSAGRRSAAKRRQCARSVFSRSPDISALEVMTGAAHRNHRSRGRGRRHRYRRAGRSLAAHTDGLGQPCSRHLCASVGGYRRVHPPSDLAITERVDSKPSTAYPLAYRTPAAGAQPQVGITRRSTARTRTGAGAGSRGRFPAHA